MHHNRTLIDCLDRDVPFARGSRIKIVDVLFFIFITLIAATIRYSVRNTISADYEICLKPWYNQVIQSGGWKSLNTNIGNYSPLYMYIFTAATYIPLNSLHVIKIITICFDYLTAAFVLGFAYVETHSPKRAIALYGVLLLLPSVIFNGAVWAQCDIIYSLFLLISCVSIYRNHPTIGCISFGIAFSFKLQAVFLFPMLIIFWIIGKINWKHFLIVPLVYLVSVIPAVALGRNLLDILSIYVHQVDTYTGSLTLNMPNFYTIIGNNFVDHLSGFGVLISIGILGLLFYYIFSKRKILNNTNLDLFILLSIIIVYLVNYFLPFMHERYTFVADILALFLLCYDVKYIWLVLSTQIISIGAYQSFLFGNVAIPYYVLSIFILLFTLFLAYRMVKRIESLAVNSLE